MATAGQEDSPTRGRPEQSLQPTGSGLKLEQSQGGITMQTLAEGSIKGAGLIREREHHREGAGDHSDHVKDTRPTAAEFHPESQSVLTYMMWWSFVIGALAFLGSFLGYGRLRAFDTRRWSTPDWTQSPFFNERSSRFAVNGSALPLIEFDVGESYAGLLPIGNDTSRQLYFWFFPSADPVARQTKEILIYLTGGPGCSSIGELVQINGPISWLPGTDRPMPNKWSWHRLTNVVWIDQPVGTGFSQGTPSVTNEVDVAEQFLGFWKNFVNTFDLGGYRVYVTGSSYAGMYAPFISSAMLDRNDTVNFNISGMAIWAGLYSKIPLVMDIPAARFVDKWKMAFPLNDTSWAAIKAIDRRCGFTAYLDEFLVFPAKGPQPSILPGEDPVTGLVRPECALYAVAWLAVHELNPCFTLFDVTSHCPILPDPLGLAGGRYILPASFNTSYFNLPAVKAALNAPPNSTWAFCPEVFTNPVFVNGVDTSLLTGPGSQPAIPRVIEGTGNVILGHGSHDFLVLPEATLLTIQNMTWHGHRGFRTRPRSPLFVPYHDNNNAAADPRTATGAGVVGTTHSERGLTWFEAALAGHLLAQDQPAVAFRMIEVLLGRVEGFTSTAPFSVNVGGREGGQPDPGTLGSGTVHVSGAVEYKHVAGKNSDVNDPQGMDKMKVKKGESGNGKGFE